MSWRSSEGWWLALAAMGAAGLFLWQEHLLAGGRWGFPLDDSWIHLQFARNLSQGDSPPVHRWVKPSRPTKASGESKGSIFMPGLLAADARAR